MSEEPQQEIIIVRRRVEGEEGHHGGAWKIAYADFVTAMMAFFLVLWILNSTNKDSQTIIARYFNPVKMEDFAKNKKGIREAQQKEEKPGSNEGDPDKAPPAGQEQGKTEQKGKVPDRDSSARSMMNDETLFQNPYAALEQIAGKVKAPDSKDSAKAGGSASETGAMDAYRDPFKPAGQDPDEDENADADAPKAPQAPGKGQAKADGAAQAKADGAAQAGEAAAGETALGAAGEAAAAAEGQRATALKKEIGKALRGEPGEGAPQLDVRATSEGLLISLTDNENFGMFGVGSSAPNPKLVHLMDRIAQSLKDQQGAVVLRGYTDARRYRNGASDNWRLSASRAQMALYMLVRGGLPETRVERVEGYADHNLKLPDKPEAAENRRIEILLRKVAP